MLDVIDGTSDPEETIALAFLMSVDRRLVGRLQIYRRPLSFEERKQTVASVGYRSLLAVRQSGRSRNTRLVVELMQGLVAPNAARHLGGERVFCQVTALNGHQTDVCRVVVNPRSVAFLQKTSGACSRNS